MCAKTIIPRLLIHPLAFSIKLLLVFTSIPLMSLAQQPLLQITSPSNGTIVNPGQTLSVNVTSPAGATFAQVDVIGELPIGISAVGSSLPAQFSLAIPSDIACGQYRVTAEGTTTTGQDAESASIIIDVERPDLPVWLSTLSTGIFLQQPSQTIPLIVTAMFPDGTTLDVTGSSYVSYTSGNTGVATVDQYGMVTAVAPGSGYIKVAYSVGGKSIQASVAVSFPVTGGSATSNFLLSIAPGTQTVAAGTSASFTVSSSSYTGFAGSITLATIGLPSGATASFSPTSINAPGSSTLTVSTLQTTPVGTNTLIVSGTSGNLNPSVSAILTVNAPGSSPTISSLSPTSGAVGTSVTISGSNFGSPQGSSTVTFNGTSATPTSWSSTSIVVPVPAGATTGNVVVTVGGAASNGVTFTVQGTINGIIFVQGATVDIANASSGSLPFESGNNAAGNWIGVCIRAGRSNEVFTVTDSKGNTYHQAVQFNDTLDTPNGNTIAIFYAENISAGANTITVSDTISATLRIGILEYTGVATANSLDVTAGAQGSSTSPSGNATTTASGDLLLGAIATADSASYSTPSGVIVREYVPGEPGTKLIAEEQIQSAAGSASATATLATSDPWGAILACFKKAHP